VRESAFLDGSEEPRCTGGTGFLEKDACDYAAIARVTAENLKPKTSYTIYAPQYVMANYQKD